MTRQIVLDTETTGLSADSGDRIIEIGCVELLNRRLTGNNLHFYLNPERDSHEDALRVHGLTTEFLRDKPKFAEVAEDLLTYLQGAEIIIHNAAFDVGFLDRELERLRKPAFNTWVDSITDTLVMAKQLYPGKRNSLDALCSRYEIDNSKRTVVRPAGRGQQRAHLARRAAGRRVARRCVHRPHARAGSAADRSGRRWPARRERAPGRLQRAGPARDSRQRGGAFRPRRCADAAG